jgi:uncharacterized protein (TIRG00374 family)
MKLNFKAFARYIPLVVSIAILIVGSTLIPWGKVEPYLLKLSPLSILLFLLLGLSYQIGRGLRYWLMFKMLEKPAPFKIIAIASMAAQPIAVLPAGELYRGILFKKYANVSLQDSSPSVLAQTISEGIVLVTISIIGASILKKYVGLTVIVGVMFFLIWVLISNYKGRKAHRILNIVPGINVHHAKVRAYLDRNQILLSNMNFAYLLAISLVSVLSGIILVAVTSNALGHPLNLQKAAIIFALPATLETFSFLPGGIGVSELGSIGLLALFGYTTPLAIALTLIVRLSTLGLGIVYGFIAMAFLKLRRYQVYE